MGRVEDLLLLEKAGELPSDMQKDLDTLRAAGEVPAFAGSAGTPASTPAPESKPGLIGDWATRTVKEAQRGASNVFSGLERMTSTPAPIGPSTEQAIGTAQAALGILSTFTSPITALGDMVGEGVTDATGSKIAGGAANIATTMLATPAALTAASTKVATLGKAVLKKLPGAQVALRDMGKEVLAALPSSLKPPISSSVLYDEVRQLNPVVQLPAFQKAAKGIVKTESDLAAYGLANTELASSAGKSAKAVSETITEPGKWLGDEFGQVASTELKDVPFAVVEKVLQRIGARIGDLRVHGGEELGAYKQLYKHLSEDLEKSANAGVGPAFTKLKEASAAANREFAIGELDDVFNATMGKAREGSTFTSSNFAQALNKVRSLRRDDPLFAKGIGAKNLDHIEGQLDELRTLKILPPPSGANVGSFLMQRNMGVMGGLGGAAGTYIAGPTGGAIGGGLGVAAGAGVPWAISRILQSPSGSKALINTLRSEGRVSPVKFGAIMGLVNSERAVSSGATEEVKAAMQSLEVPLEFKIQAAAERDRMKRTNQSARELLDMKQE